MKVIGNKLHTEHMIITFHRTLRLPEDGKTYPLPASLGHFPLKRIDDYKDKVPASWAEKGGVFLPIHQREAMWMSFQQKGHLPCAIRVGIGKVSALTGKTWKAYLRDNPQNYLVAPPQPWLDGIKGEDGTVRQFVAMALGQGYTVEGQVTGEETHGGIQLAICPGKESRFPKVRLRTRSRSVLESFADGFESYSVSDTNIVDSLDFDPGDRGIPISAGAASKSVSHKAAAMGMGAGGTMEQEIYKDPHGIEAWDQSKSERVFVHLVNAQLWTQITGEAPPKSPVTRAAYEKAGLPWYEIHDSHLAGTQPSEVLNGVKTISQMDAKHGFEGQQDDTPANVGGTVNCGTPVVAYDKQTVRDGTW